MFLTCEESWDVDFDPETHLQPSERAIYAARAKQAKERYVWSPALLPVFKNCLVHLSANVPGKIAYYASIPNMMTNRLTRTSPEMFLNRSLAKAPAILQTAWMVEVLGKTLPELQFIENDDPDGWFEIYDNGPHSCMAGSDKIRQFAHHENNLALVYIKDRDGKVSHRTIVNKERKTYLRCYGGTGYEFFIAALNRAGYTHSGDTLRDEIIELDYAECEKCGADVLVGPYLDGSWDLIKRIPPRKPALLSRSGVIGNRGETLYYGEDVYCGCDEDEEYDDER